MSNCMTKNSKKSVFTRFVVYFHHIHYIKIIKSSEIYRKILKNYVKNSKKIFTKGVYESDFQTMLYFHNTR